MRAIPKAGKRIENRKKEARKIRALPRTDAASVPIVAMSTNAFAEDVERSLQSGMNGHLSKPINTGELYARMNEIFKGI